MSLWLPNLVVGSVGSAFAVGDTSLTLGTGQGAALFASFTSGKVCWLRCTDNDLIPTYEILLRATAISGDVLTVDAAAATNSSGSALAVGDIVEVVLTEEAKDQLITDAVTAVPTLVGDSGSGGTAGLVPAPASGDAAAGKILGASGGWVTPTSANSIPLATLVPPVVGDFTWANQGSSTVDGTGGQLYLETPAVSGYHWRIFHEAMPGASFTLSAAITRNSLNAMMHGICLYDSVSGKFLALYYYQGSIYIYTWSNFTTAGSAIGVGMTRQQSGPLDWLGIGYTSVSAIDLKSSRDGIHWITLATTNQSAFFTPDRIGACLMSNDANLATAMNVVSWEKT